MMAISAVRAICSPKVGPIELEEKSSTATPKSSSSACSTSSTSLGLELRHRDLHDVLAELRIVDLLDLGVAVAERRERVAHVIDAGGRSSGVVIRVPDSKSMPKLIPCRRWRARRPRGSRPRRRRTSASCP